MSLLITSLYTKLNPLNNEDCLRLGRVLMTLGLGLLMEVEEYHAIDESQPDRRGSIRRFIHYNAHRNIRLSDLAGVLYLSPSRAGHVVREIFDRSFQDLLIPTLIA